MILRRDGNPNRVLDDDGAVLGSVLPSADEWSDELAARIRNLGLRTPALLWGECMKPLGFLGGQSLRMLEPLWGLVSDSPALERTAALLEDRQRLNRFLETLARDPAAPPADSS